MQHAAELQFPFKKGQIILTCGDLDGVVFRIIRFHQNFAGQRAAPCASGHLGEELKCAFGGAKVRQAELRIRGDDADQRHALKIVAFGHHLRAHQDIYFS